MGLGHKLGWQTDSVHAWICQVANREVGQNLADHLAFFTWFALQTEGQIEPDNPACSLEEISKMGFFPWFLIGCVEG